MFFYRIKYNKFYVIVFSIYLLFFMRNAINLAFAATYGAEPNPTGSPIGGGAGYSDIKSPAEADYLVGNKSELLSALFSATSGQIVYVDDGAVINLTGEKQIKIPPKVTLASGRGSNGSLGGLLYTDDLTQNIYPFLLISSESRVTGLRVRGPDQEIRDVSYGFPLSYGIGPLYSGSAEKMDNWEVDNCEIFGWPYVGVFVYRSTGVYIHHNYIHHCQRRGLGYGVSHYYYSGDSHINPGDGPSSIIEANIFDWCRHAIAGSRTEVPGDPVNNYEARYNIVLEHATSHSFDMHGGADVGDLTKPAGGEIRIHHNTFKITSQSALVIRGIPEVGAWVYNNWALSTAAPDYIFRQNGVIGYDKMYVYDNYYGPVPPPDYPLETSVPSLFNAPQNAIWYDAYNKGPLDWGFGVIVDSAGYVYVVGSSHYDFRTIKYSAVNGELIWKKDENIGGYERAFDVAIDSLGYIYVTGKAYSVNYNWYTIKYDSDGNFIWNKSYNSGGDDVAYAIAVDGSYFYVTGVASGDCLTIKYDLDGNIIWQKKYDTGNYERGQGIAIYDSNVYVTGMENNSLNYDYFTVKYDSDGNLISGWPKIYDSGESDCGYDVVVDTYGYVYVAGMSHNTKDWDYRTIKYDPLGNIIWNKTYDSEGWDYAQSMAIDSANDVYITGYAEKYKADGTDRDYLTVKYDTDGNFIGAREYDSGDIDQAYSIDVDDGGFIYITGFSVNGANMNCLTIKYTSEMTFPNIVTSNPAGVNVPVDANISITFSELMNNTSVENSFSISPLVFGSFIWEDVKMIFHPNVYLNYGQGYTVTVKREAKDLFDNNLTSEYSWQFTTIGEDKKEKMEIFPNPYVKGKSLNEIINFINLPQEATIRIYTISGKLIKTIKHQDTTGGGNKEWDISGVAGGIYMYTIISSEGKKTGKVSIVK